VGWVQWVSFLGCGSGLIDDVGIMHSSLETHTHTHTTLCVCFCECVCVCFCIVLK
jgi:hypothetical protein